MLHKMAPIASVALLFEFLYTTKATQRMASTVSVALNAEH